MNRNKKADIGWETIVWGIIILVTAVILIFFVVTYTDVGNQAFNKLKETISFT